jgi:transposase
MANRRIRMEKLKEILRLGSEHHLSNRAIARALKVSRPVVAQYLSDFRASGLTYSEISTMNHDDVLELFSRNRRFEKQRYTVLTEQFNEYVKELKRPGVTRYLLWEEYRQAHPEGYSYSQFCYHFQVWQDISEISMHMEHKAGDRMFVDFTGKKLFVSDPKTGVQREAEVFVAILGASQLTYAEARYTQQKADWIKANENALRYIGGVPRAIVPDCLKSGVTKGDKYDPDVNPEYADFARYYDTVILPARPHAPRDKALVENAVKIVYNRVFAPLRNQPFYSLEELNRAIREKLAVHNSRCFQRLQISRQQLFQEIEKAVLKPLPVNPYELRSFKFMQVQFNYHVYLSDDGHYYSVPYPYRGRKVRIAYTTSIVEIYHKNTRIAFHKRNLTQNKYTTVAEHMPPNHRFYKDWCPEKILEWAAKKGPNVQELVAKLLEKGTYPEQTYKTCLGVINLSKQYGNQRVDLACQRALEFHYYSYKAVKNILAKGLENIAEVASLQSKLPDHENIRGSDYYR